MVSVPKMKSPRLQTDFFALKDIFEKLHFRDGLWMMCLTVKIKMCLKFLLCSVDAARAKMHLRHIFENGLNCANYDHGKDGGHGNQS